MRLVLVVLLAASGLAACEPNNPTPDAQPPAAPAEPAAKTPEQRRRELQTDSAQRQIEAQMREQAQVQPAPDPAR